MSALSRQPWPIYGGFPSCWNKVGTGFISSPHFRLSLDKFGIFAYIAGDGSGVISGNDDYDSDLSGSGCN